MLSYLHGENIKWDDEYNLYDYFTTITLNKDTLNNLAVLYDGIKLSYKDVAEITTRISSYVYRKIDSIRDEKRVKLIGIHLSPDLYLVPILLSIHRLACSYVPLDHNLPPERVKYILNNASFDCIITNASDYSHLIENKPEIPLIHLHEALQANMDENFDSKIQRSIDSIACVLFTSGSTGNPKGVCLNHRSIINRLKWQWKEFPLEKNIDFGVQKTSLNFADHICEIFAFILKGLPLLIVDPILVSNIPKFIDVIYEHKITYLILVPSLLNNIISYANHKLEFYKLEMIKRWVCSGEALNYKTLEAFFNMKLKDAILSNLYGSTEVTGDVTFISFKTVNDILPYRNSSIPIGFPISNSSIEILDDKMNCVKLKEIGEIYAIGYCLADGYLSKTTNNAKFLIHEGKLKFKTGDYGYIEENILFYSGRRDTQIKIRGNRVDLNEIEFNALKIDEIEQFIPLVYENENNKLIIGFYKTKTDICTNIIEKAINDALKCVLFEYMLPNKLFRLESVPQLYNGKIDKISLLRLFEKNYYSTDENVKTISKLIVIIEMVTKIKIKPNDFNSSLNQIGVDSLNLLNIFLLLEEEGVKISFNDFLSVTTLKELIDLFESATKNKLEKNKISTERILYGKTKFGEKLSVVLFSENPELAEKVLLMCAQTYAQKSPLEIALNITEENFYEEFHPMVDALKNSEESFGVIDEETGKLVGGAFICDITLPLYFHEKKIKPLLAFLDGIKQSIVDKLLIENKKILHSMLVTTAMECNTNENVILIDFIETEIISIAKRFNYNAIVTVNTIKITEVSRNTKLILNSIL